MGFQERLDDLRGALDSLRQRMGAWFTVAMILLGAAPVAAGGLGLWGYQRRLANDDSFCIRPAELNLVKATSWMTPDIAREVRAALEQLPPRLSVMDKDAASRVARSLEANPWVREVEYVRLNRPSGGASGKGVEISLKMRRPVAFVAVERDGGRQYVLVDREGVRLGTSAYRVPLLGDRALLVITGIESDPPPAGASWSDPMLLAAVEVAQMFRRDVARLGLARVHVALRRSGRGAPQPHVALFTHGDRTKIDWGGRPSRMTEIREGRTTRGKRYYLKKAIGDAGGIDRIKSIDLIEWYRRLRRVPRRTTTVAVS